MKLKKDKKEVLEGRISARCRMEDENRVKAKALLYTDGNLSEWVLYASLNFVPNKSDFEPQKKTKKGKK